MTFRSPTTAETLSFGWLASFSGDNQAHLSKRRLQPPETQIDDATKRQYEQVGPSCGASSEDDDL
jgi:hypothetical protein